MRRVLLLGSSGFLGTVLAEKLARTHAVVPCHRSRPALPRSRVFDLFADEPEPMFSAEEPDLVVIAARLFDPSAPPGPPERAAFERFLRTCGSRPVTLVSTDAVFDGERGLYAEGDERSPGTAYGTAMRDFEDAVLAHGERTLIVRLSYLYGFSAGRLDRRLAKTREALCAGRSVPLFDDMFKSPIEVGQAAEAIARLVTAERSGVAHVAGPRLSVYAFQREAMLALGERVDGIVPTKRPSTPDFPRDTSLRTERMTRLTGVEPGPVAALRTAGGGR